MIVIVMGMAGSGRVIVVVCEQDRRLSVYRILRVRPWRRTSPNGPHR